MDFERYNGIQMDRREELKNKVKEFPAKPGVYKMLDANGTIIYIGKSKCLKKRVKTYFVDHPKWDKVNKMLPHIYNIEYEVTDTHLEAMLLECRLIKEIKPFFNCMMKNEDRYVYLKVETKKSKKPLSIVYEREENCFGPFRRKSNLVYLIELLRNIYPIGKERRKYLFEYHVMPQTMDTLQFEINQRSLLEIFQNMKRMDCFNQELKKKMKLCVQEMKFERAMKYRDLINCIAFIRNGLEAYQDLINQLIYVDIEIKSGHKLFLIQYGKILKCEIWENVTKDIKDHFIQIDSSHYQENAIGQEKKGDIDYRDIIYSELLHALSEKMEIININK